MKTNENLLEAVLFYIKDKLDIFISNKHGGISQPTPFDTSGEDFKSNIFNASPFDGNFDYEGKELDETPPNFTWRDFKVYWYKYLGRGMEWNREISNNELVEMLDECIEFLNTIDK